MQAKLKRQSILISYIIGAPVGILTVIIVFALPVMLTGEGLATMALVAMYGKAILGLIISFIIALGIAGTNAYKNLINQKSLLQTSFKYSLTVNLIIWLVFIGITIADNINKDIWLLLPMPVIAFILCVVLTTFTIGLLICYIIKQIIVRAIIK